ncbi:fibronectin type III domain-containing protein [Chloroflexota bacterium]
MYTPLGATVKDLLGSVTGGTGSGLDITKPQISDVTVTAGQATARIDWTTSEAASTQVEYGQNQQSTSLEPAQPEHDPTSGTSAGVVTHSVTLTGLIPSTPAAKVKYWYRVKSKDAAGNESVSEWKTFETEISDT